MSNKSKFKVRELLELKEGCIYAVKINPAYMTTCMREAFFRECRFHNIKIIPIYTHNIDEIKFEAKDAR